MSNQDSKSIIHDFWKAIEVNDEEAMRRLLAPDIVVYNPTGSQPQDRQTFMQGFLHWNRPFSANHFEIEDQFCEGDRVATQGIMQAVHDVAPFQGIPPSGKAIAGPGIVIDHVREGAIVERHVCSDRLGMMQQLGIVPAAPVTGKVYGHEGGGRTAGPHSEKVRLLLDLEPKEDPVMNSEQQKSISRRYFEACQRNDQAGLKELLLSDLVAYNPGLPHALTRDELLQMIDAFAHSFGDETYTIEDQIAEGDRVATRVTWRAKHSGPFQGLPPTGKRVAVGGISISRIDEGRIAERWLQMDQMGLLRQLGLVP